MLTIQQIINESDTHLPNVFETAQKVMWLNEVNNEFFESVKIPRTLFFDVWEGDDTYVVDVKPKNIDKVVVGATEHLPFNYNDVRAGRCYWSYEDATKTMRLNPEPTADEKAIVRYYQSPHTAFLTSNLTASPDAPEEYHWLYILGLCERMAKAMNDFARAANYGSDFRNQLVVAQQQYQRGVVT